jgi:hypothetical protein
MTENDFIVIQGMGLGLIAAGIVCIAIFAIEKSALRETNSLALDLWRTTGACLVAVGGIMLCIGLTFHHGS